MCTRHVIPIYIYFEITHVSQSQSTKWQRVYCNPVSLDDDPKAGAKETARFTDLSV